MTQRLLVALGLLSVSCASSAERREPPTLAPGAVRQRYNVVLNGYRANEDKRARCAREIELAGGVNDPTLPVTVVLTLEDRHNQIQVISSARGVVRSEDLPGWDMGRLCREAIATYPQALAQEPPPGYRPAPPPPSYYPAQPGVYGYAPPPPPPRPVPTVRLQPAPQAPPSLLPPPADAAKAVTELTDRGAQFYARGDYPNALVAFAEANRQSSNAPLLFNTALCYKMLNRPQEALQYLQLYVDRAPAAPNRKVAEQLLSEIRRSLGDEE
jgi:hypothetical protein